MALLTALHELKRDQVPAAELAEQACHIEMDLAGHPVGKQDHYVAAVGGIICLDIAPDGQVDVSRIDLSEDTLDHFRSTVLLFYTGLTRQSSEILQEQSTDTEQNDHTVLSSLHRTKEIGLAIREALERGRVDEFGRLLDEHWQIKKETIGENQRLAFGPLVCTLRKRAVHCGGKVIGAGGGGFFMFQCPVEQQGGPSRRACGGGAS